MSMWWEMHHCKSNKLTDEIYGQLLQSPNTVLYVSRHTTILEHCKVNGLIVVHTHSHRGVGTCI